MLPGEGQGGRDMVKEEGIEGTNGKNRRSIAFGDFSAEFLAFEKDNAAIGFGVVSKGHIGLKPSPFIKFDRAAGDLARCAVERTIEGLEIGHNLIVGGLALIANG